jgi:pimeloyl-ACP methyl ester carboxylesterase
VFNRSVVGGASLLSLLVALAGCSSSSSGGPSGPPVYTPPPASTVIVDSGPVSIRRELVLVPGVTPPPNPVLNKATPVAQNQLRITRYRVDADPPRPARAIVVFMPGFLGGAGSVDGIAKAVVRRSTAQDAYEGWAIDRRANLLEDTWGEDVAESFQDPSQANAYYFQQATVQGHTFEGFLTGEQMPWASEWGLATTVGDLHNVLALVPQADRASRVILAGHSLGGSIVEEYAAWDFAGTPGYADLAGLVMIDGVAGGEGASTLPVTQDVYEQGGAMAPGGFGTSLGLLHDIRPGNTLFTLPLLGVKVYAIAEYTAMRAHWTGPEVEADSDRDALLSVLLSTPKVPPMTDRATFGFAFNKDSEPLSFVAVTCGEPTGGPIGPVTSALGGTIQAPTSSTATYAWIDYDKSTPRGNTSIDDFARAWYEGPQLNFGEWYFTQRLVLDPGAAATLVMSPTDWPVATYGLAAEHGHDIDVPILGAACALVGTTSAFDSLKSTVKTPASQFQTIAQPQLSHLDCVNGTDDAGSDVNKWYDALVAFATSSTPSGGVVVPVQ